MLKEFVPRFNRRVGVPPQCPEPAVRLWTSSCAWSRFCVSSTAGRWPGTIRCGSSCAHSSCCQRRNDPVMPGRLWKGWMANSRYATTGASIVAAQEAPLGPAFLRNGHGPYAVPPVASFGVNHWHERWTVHLMPLTSSQEHDADQQGVTDGEHASPPTATVAPRKPTFLQKERWKAVQKARRKGMSLRAIERELGIHRSTIRKYLEAGGPPRRQSRTVSISLTSDTMAT